MNKQDFPILSRQVYGRPLVYLDNGATTQKPLCVLDAMRDEYLNANANVHRGVHYLSGLATDMHEAARERVRQFLGAQSTQEIIFTRGTTESLNLVAATYPLAPGDEVIVSTMEHHSNIVPWQLRGATLRPVPLLPDGTLDLDAYRRLFTPRTRLVAVAHVSNVLGTVNPVSLMASIAHQHHVPMLVDGAQSAPHLRIDVQALGCDFFACSGHKMYGPTGIGVLYGRRDLLDAMPPYQGGGDMIDQVAFDRTTYAQLPYKFEAGTPDYIAAHGLATAIDYIDSIGLDSIEAHERHLTDYAINRLQEVPGMTIFGPKAGDVAPSPHAGGVGFCPHAGRLPESRTVASDRPSAPLVHDISFSNGALGRSEATVRLSGKRPACGQKPTPPACGQKPTPPARDAVVSFLIKDDAGRYIHHLDVGTLLDRLGIAVRTGHHCAQPLHDALGIQGTVRASFALYNDEADVDALVAALQRVRTMLC